MKKSVLSVSLSRLIGILIFLILLVIANILNVNHVTYVLVIQFLNENLGLIVLFSIFFYIGELFGIFSFPFNLPGPFFNAFGGVFLLRFLWGLTYLTEEIVSKELFSAFRQLEPIIYPLVFFIILIASYIRILNNSKDKPAKSEKETNKPEKKEKTKNR